MPLKIMVKFQAELVVYMSIQKNLPGHLHHNTRHPIPDVNTAEDIPDDDFIPDYPRYYLSPNKSNRMRLKARFIDEVPGGDCSTEESEYGENTCFVNNWLNETIIKSFDCTLPYLLDNVAKNKSACHPALIVRNYENAIHQRSSFENVYEVGNRTYIYFFREFIAVT
jgi:hypothetical protein